MNTFKINPLFICYANDAHLRALQFAKPTAAFVLGRANCIQDAWQDVRARGAEANKYYLPTARPDSPVSRVDEEQYFGDSSKVPLWPYKDAAGNYRSNYPGTKLVDLRVGSAFVKFYVDYVAEQIRLRRYDGAFFDTFGGRLWTSAKWDEWPAGEQAEWTAGAVDFIRQLDIMRCAEDPGHIYVCNNTWDNVPDAQQYMDGICSENHPITNVLMQKTVGRPYSNLGHRRVFKITRTVEEAAAWADIQGVTHVCCTAANTAAGNNAYSYPTPPVVPYNDLRDPALRIAELEEALKVANAHLQDVVQQLAKCQGDLQQSSARADSLQAQLDNLGLAHTALMTRFGDARTAWHQLEDTFAL